MYLAEQLWRRRPRASLLPARVLNAVLSVIWVAPPPCLVEACVLLVLFFWACVVLHPPVWKVSWVNLRHISHLVFFSEFWSLFSFSRLQFVLTRQFKSERKTYAAFIFLFSETHFLGVYFLILPLTLFALLKARRREIMVVLSFGGVFN